MSETSSTVPIRIEGAVQAHCPVCELEAEIHPSTFAPGVPFDGKRVGVCVCFCETLLLIERPASVRPLTTEDKERLPIEVVAWLNSVRRQIRESKAVKS